MDEDLTLFTTLFMLIGTIIGIIGGLILMSTGDTETFKTDVLESACQELYGEDYHWVEGEVGTETQLICQAEFPSIKPSSQPEPLIIKREMGKCRGN